MNYEINREIVFSTAHITVEDAKRLEKIASTNEFTLSDLTVTQLTHGFRIYVSPDVKHHALENTDGMSDEFWNLMALAVVNECDNLLLDCDGEIYSNLKSFDW